jgi:hypothetical protein
MARPLVPRNGQPNRQKRPHCRRSRRHALEYAVRELQKDVEAAVTKLGREGEKTNFSIFVLHNKDKAKKGQLPQEILKGRYIAARTVGDVWINYPWEATYVLLFLYRSCFVICFFFV